MSGFIFLILVLVVFLFRFCFFSREWGASFMDGKIVVTS